MHLMPLDVERINPDADYAEMLCGLEESCRRNPHSRLLDTPLATGLQHPYWDLVARLQQRSYARKFEGQHRWEVQGHGLQAVLQQRYSPAIPSPADLEWCRGMLGRRPVVHIGARNGYWARLTWLIDDKIKVVAYDPNPCRGWHLVQRGMAQRAALHPDSALMLVAPPHGEPDAVDALTAYRGDLLIYVGARAGGANATKEFFLELERGWVRIGSSATHPSFSGTESHLDAYKRKGVGR